MIKSVTITNYVGDEILLELYHPEKSGFVITSITGLGPGKAEINKSDLSTTDGSIFNSARLSARNIVINLKLMAKNMVEDIRLLSYKYFPIKKKVTMEFVTDNRDCLIEGYVESNDPIIFSSSETTQISIICPDPYFYEKGDVVQLYFGVNPLFEFPWDNNHLFNPLIKFGEITGMIAKTIHYEGDAMVGMNITINITNEIHSNIEIANGLTEEKMVIDVEKIIQTLGGPLIAEDNIYICTITGKKSMFLLRNGVYTNIINCLAKDTNWLHLDRGDNIVTFISATDMEYIQVEIDYKIVYEGI